MPPREKDIRISPEGTKAETFKGNRVRQGQINDNGVNVRNVRTPLNQ